MGPCIPDASIKFSSQQGQAGFLDAACCQFASWATATSPHAQHNTITCETARTAQHEAYVTGIPVTKDPKTCTEAVGKTSTMAWRTRSVAASRIVASSAVGSRNLQNSTISAMGSGSLHTLCIYLPMVDMYQYVGGYKTIFWLRICCRAHRHQAVMRAGKSHSITCMSGRGLTLTQQITCLQRDMVLCIFCRQG